MSMKRSIAAHLDKWEEYVLFSVMLFMLGTLLVQVFCRYVLSFSFSWAEQSARIGFVWLTMTGISLAAKQGIHLKVDALVQFLPPRPARLIALFSDVFTMGFGVYMGWLIFKTVLMQIRTHQVFASIPWLPTWTMYMAGTIGMLGLTVRTLQRVLRAARANSAAAEGGA
jgi:TRAP-type C4-dicarboxylate transport system permease small subunit